MRNFILNFLASRAGIPKIPESKEEFMNLINSNPVWKQQIDNAEKAGVLKRDDDGTLTVLDQEKAYSMMQHFLMQIAGGKNG